jgi:2-haloacid dehalogenase
MSATTTLSPAAILFDAFGTLFDVHAVVAAAEQMFPGTATGCRSSGGASRSNIRSCARSPIRPARAIAVRDITLDALRFAARALGLALNSAAEKRLMDQYACLSTYPDTVPALRRLRALEPRPALAILSNGNPDMLDIAVKSAGMAGLFDRVLSVDAVRAYKPSPLAYALGTAAFGARPRELVFVSSNAGTSRAPPGSATRRSGSTAPARPPTSSARRPTAPAAAWSTCSHSSPPRLRPADRPTARAPARAHDARCAAASPFHRNRN